MPARRPRKRTTARRSRPRSRPRTRRSSPRSRRRGSLLWLLPVLVVVVGVIWHVGGLTWLEDAIGGPGEAAPDQQIDEVDADRAREQLAELTVAEWGSMRGYSRDRFPHWQQVDGCDARQTVLRRDGEAVTATEDSCQVASGSWYSPFDGQTLSDPSDVDIDHLVPLANAWRTGASDWDEDRRAEFANDLDRPQLIAVSASSNRAKGDQDPSQWQPQRSYWCQYAHDWVVVKHYWELSVTAAEHDALTDMLETCD